MLKRAGQATVHQRLASYPAVAIVGPRQCGKTTLARTIGASYFDLEQPEDRVRVDLGWNELIAETRPVIFDEAQSWPELFPRLRGAIDADRKRNGRFLLLGSVAPSLMNQVSESLAGRLSVLELTPFLWNELAESHQRDLWLVGGFPDGGILEPGRFPGWQRDFLLLLAQRDLPNWGLPATAATIDRLMRMVAALHGQSWNASTVGQSLALSYHTVNTYVDYLEGAFLIRRLAAYQTNLKKRLVKRPKIYWRDSGLLHAMLNVPDQNSLLRQPWVGASWEGFVIEQTLGALAARGVPVTPYYFRTSDGVELDLLLELPGERVAIEIKLTTAPTLSDLSALDRAADLVQAERRYLVSQTSAVAGDRNRASCNLPRLLAFLLE